MRIQIYSAITAYCMMAIVQNKMEIGRLIYEKLQLASASLAKYKPLNKLSEKTNNTIVNKLDDSSESTSF